MPRIGLLAAILGAFAAANGRACIAAYHALPAPAPDVLPAVAAIPPLPDAGFGTLPEAWIPSTGVLALSSNLDFGPADSGSMPPDPPNPPGLLLPIFLMLAGGAAWRLYTSPVYLRLYRGSFGPLNQY